MSTKDEQFIREQIRLILEDSATTAGTAGSTSSRGTQYGRAKANSYGTYLKSSGQHYGTKWDTYVPSTELAYQTFVQPFVDAFKVAKAVLKDIMSATLLTLEAAVTLSPAKKKDLQTRFQADRQKYKSELDSAMTNVDAAFNTPDAKMLGFMLAPGPALGYAMTNAVGDMADPLTDNLGERLGGFATAFGMGDVQVKAAERKAGIAASTDRGPLRGLAHDMKVLFFGPQMGAGMPESVNYLDRLEKVLYEGDETEDDAEEEEAVEVDVAEATAIFIEESGLQQKFDEIGDAIIAAKKEEIEFISEDLKEKLTTLHSLSQSRTLAEIQPLFAKLKTMDIDLTEHLGEVKKAIEDQKKMLGEGGEEADALKKELQVTEDGKRAQLTDDSDIADYSPVIEVGVVSATFTDVVETAKSAAASGLMEFVTEGMSQQDLDSIAQASEKGAAFAELIGNFESQIGEILSKPA
jgi:hypothetical protein